jgi:hypothetical protein
MRAIVNLCFALLLGGSAIANSQTVAIQLGGSKIGSNSYELKADGTFESKSELNLVGNSITSRLIGKFDGPKLSNYQYTTTTQGKTSTIQWDGAKLTIKMADQPQIERELKFDQGLYFSNFHPILVRSLGALPAQTRTAKIYLLDGGAVLDAEIQTKVGKIVVVNGSSQRISIFELKFAGISADVALDERKEFAGIDVPSQTFQFIREGFEDVFLDPVLAFKELSQPTFKVKRVTKEFVPMRDGVKLAHDAAIPEAEGKYPTILIRTPYGRAAQMIQADWWARRGYVYLVQDVRGREDSEGNWDPFLAERADGYYTIDWITKQPWSNGKVGMIGASYGGYVQWAAALERHPALLAIVPQVSPPDLMTNIPYENGTFLLFSSLWWSRIVIDRKTNMTAATTPVQNIDGLLQLPISRVDDAVLGRNIDFFDGWVRRRVLADFRGSITAKEMAKVKIPALHISGWWDGDGIGTKTNWATMRSAGNKNQWLIYGPWPHAFNTSTQLGDVDYGPSAILELNSLYLRWFDTWLKGADVGLDEVPKVRAFLTGKNEWLNLKDWPDPDWKEESWYLAAPGPANGPTSQGQLVSAPPKADEPSRYVYNPAAVKIPDELRTLNAMDPSSATTKIKLTDEDHDTLVFRSNPLESDYDLKGSIEAELFVSTTAKDADFFVSVVDIHPNGEIRAIGLQGKQRLMYRSGNEKVLTVKPGQIYKINVAVWDTAHRFRKGHRIGLLVTSDIFPMMARNLGLGEPNETAVRMIAAAQTIYHDPKRPSRLIVRTRTPRNSPKPDGE